MGCLLEWELMTMYQDERTAESLLEVIRTFGGGVQSGSMAELLEAAALNDQRRDETQP